MFCLDILQRYIVSIECYRIFFIAILASKVNLCSPVTRKLYLLNCLCNIPNDHVHNITWGYENLYHLYLVKTYKETDTRHNMSCVCFLVSWNVIFKMQLHHGNGYNLHSWIVLKTLFSNFLVCGTISHDGSHIIFFLIICTAYKVTICLPYWLCLSCNPEKYEHHKHSVCRHVCTYFLYGQHRETWKFFLANLDISLDSANLEE